MDPSVCGFVGVGFRWWPDTAVSPIPVICARRQPSRNGCDSHKEKDKNSPVDDGHDSENRTVLRLNETKQLLRVGNLGNL
jgi:hypothetical protein